MTDQELEAMLFEVLHASQLIQARVQTMQQELAKRIVEQRQEQLKSQQT